MIFISFKQKEYAGFQKRELDHRTKIPVVSLCESSAVYAVVDVKKVPYFARESKKQMQEQTPKHVKSTEVEAYR